MLQRSLLTERHFRFESNVSLPSANLDSVDVIVQTIPDNGEHVARTKIRTNADLRSFIQYTKQRNHRNPEYLFLIEDISQGVIDVLQTELGFNALAAENHKQGQVNNCQSRPTKNALHSEKLSSTFYSTNIRLPTASCLSLSWWRLLSQNMEGNRLEGEAFVESKADTSRVITPLFLVQIEEKKTDHKDSSKSGKWYTRYPKNAIKTAVGGFNPLKKADMYEQSVFKLDCHTYRPHQVVTEVKDFMWASACEERISLCDIRTDTAYYYIILLDKPRHLKQHDRGIQIEDTKTSKLPFVWNSPSSKPIARIISEEPAASRLTFLSSNSGFALNRNAKQGVFSQLESDEDLDPSDEIGDSTRARLLQSMRAKLFEQCIPEDRGVFVEIRSRLISIIADDWNLLLSQMRQTLDEIDCKISDDHELHENVPVWRRILCSWRVNIIEYSSRLSDVHRLAEYHAQPHKEKSSTRRAQHCRIRKRNSSISSTSHLDDEEAYRLMERYEDIKIGLADISGRVDRSFQALMSSMSIVESGKAISQGTAVARLTELAFFFIPLNFACSFFSMQITNFSGNKQPSIGAFFGLGFGLVLFLYGLRGAIRSRLLSKFREKLEKQIRETSGLPSNSNIPTQVVLNYGWQEINPYIRVFLVTLPAFALILALTISLSHHKAFKISVAVVLGVGAFPIIGNFLAGNVKRSLRYTIGVAWLIAIFSVTLERTEHLEVIVTTAQCVSLATVFVAFLTLVPGTFRKPWESATQIILPLWMAVLPIGGILHSYLVNVPHWEPWVLTIGLQAIVIFFGSFVGALRLDFYRGIPEIAALIGVIVGIPTSIIWQYLPSHGNPVPQYAVIILTFSCSIICCIFLWCIPRLRRLRFVSRISASAQTFCVLCITAGMPIALAWAYYPTYGRVYTNVIDYNTTVFAQPLSSFYGTPIHLWIQVSINLGALVLLAIAFTIHALFTQNTVLLFFAWLISGIAVIPWLPILLYIDDIEAFEVLTRNHWKRKLLAGMSVVFWVTIWAFLWYSARRYLVNKWPKELSYDEAGSELESQRSTSSHDHGASDDSSTCGNVSSSGSLRQGVWVKADEGEYSVY